MKQRYITREQQLKKLQATINTIKQESNAVFDRHLKRLIAQESDLKKDLKRDLRK